MQLRHSDSDPKCRLSVLLVGFVLCAGLLGCQLAVDFDRSLLADASAGGADGSHATGGVSGSGGTGGTSGVGGIGGASGVGGVGGTGGMGGTGGTSGAGGG